MLDKKYTILIVDDEEDNLALLYRTLRADFNIIKTTSPIQALNLILGNEIDIIISDHKMPEMDGVEFLKRSCEINSHCVRILVTAYSDLHILIDAINSAKVYRYIKKPWEPAELCLTVKSAVEYYQLKCDNDKLINDLKELFSGTISAIIEALDAKDSFTLGKSKRVTYFALKMAQYFKLSSEETSKLELAGLLHDIGMIGVSEEVLNKTTVLSNEEFESIKLHVNHGIKILEDIKQLKGVVEIIKYHHERVDGKGYPYGAKDIEIPLNAKIICIADAYDSMVSNRSYRQGLSHEEAMSRIIEQSGKQFDPVVVDAFMAIVKGAIVEIKEHESKLADKI